MISERNSVDTRKALPGGQGIGRAFPDASLRPRWLFGMRLCQAAVGDSACHFFL